MNIIATICAFYAFLSAAILWWSRRCFIVASIPSPPSLVHFFADRFVVLIIVITGGRPVRTRAFSPSLDPYAHPPYTRSPPPLAIDFGQANYIFSPIVERIKL